MSAPTSGNFDCARLQEIKANLSTMFVNDGVLNADLQADVAPLQAIIDMQTASFTPLEDPMKDNTVKAVWFDNCGNDAVEDCNTDECAIDGVEGGTQCAEYELDICLESPGFKVTEKKFRSLGNTISQNQEISRMLARELQKMDQAVANRSVSFLNASVGENLNNSPYAPSSGYTNIPATAWNPDIFGYFEATRRRNKLPNMRLILGGLMEQYLWKIGMETSTGEGQNNARKVGSLGTVYTDSFTTEDVLTYKAAFLVNPDSVGFVSKAYHTPYGAGRVVPIDGGGNQTLYTVRSLAIPSITYDVIYQVKCIGNDIVHIWKLKFKGGFFLNPTGCNTDRTGVLEFRCAS
jgi:hypothetical protein